MVEFHPDHPISGRISWVEKMISLSGSFFSVKRNEFADLVSADQHSAVFESQRSAFILLRIRLMASLFAVLTPLWIPVDMLVFTHVAWVNLAFGRIVASFAFTGLVFYCRRAISFKHAYWALVILFSIPSLFFLFSHLILSNTLMSKTGMIAASSYAFLPFVMVAGISIFPLTIRESIAFVLPLLLISSLPMITSHTYMIPNFKAIAVFWLLILVATVGILSSISQLQLMHNLFTQSVIDPLTGVFNRRSGIEMIALQLALARRRHYPLALVFVDLDNFKQINDNHGHDAGDQLLVQVADAWQETLRSSDIILRWGGEEFVFLLPHTNGKGAEEFIRERCPAVQKPDATIQTYSFGVAEWLTDNITHGSALVSLADQRMYQAKIQGKNCIVGCTGNDHAGTIELLNY